jgi:2-dehydro-3-deoxyphosphogluconate aldolase/(4S)-4-hydroxy-2-oxoglutarate aldolase
VSTGEVLEAIGAARIVPVVTLEDGADAAPLAEALASGGLPVIEITLRTPAGLDAVRAASRGGGPSVVGAGTVLSAEAADAVIDAGARFVVSPGPVGEVLEACRARGVLVVPGIGTVTELLTALRLGCHIVKVFPAATLGGPAFLRALAALGTGARFVPTGGVTAESARDYLAVADVLAVGGSWMVPADRIAARDWSSIRELASGCAALRERA